MKKDPEDNVIPFVSKPQMTAEEKKLRRARPLNLIVDAPHGGTTLLAQQKSPCIPADGFVCVRVLYNDASEPGPVIELDVISLEGDSKVPIGASGMFFIWQALTGYIARMPADGNEETLRQQRFLTHMLGVLGMDVNLNMFASEDSPPVGIIPDDGSLGVNQHLTPDPTDPEPTA